MHATLPCPGCNANLLVPDADAERMQCPRCGQVFARGNTAIAAGPIARPAAAQAEDHELFERLRHVRPLHALHAHWVALFAVLALAASAVAFSINAYSEWEFANGQRVFNINHNLRLHFLAWTWIEWTIWPAVLLFAFWLAESCRDATRLQPRTVLPSPVNLGWYFLLPIINVIVAYVALQQLWRASDPWENDDDPPDKTFRSSWLIRAVAILYLLAALATFLAFRFDRLGREFTTASRILLVVANTSLVAANATMIAIIGWITWRQRARYIRLYEDPP